MQRNTIPSFEIIDEPMELTKLLRKALGQSQAFVERSINSDHIYNIIINLGFKGHVHTQYLKYVERAVLNLPKFRDLSLIISYELATNISNNILSIKNFPAEFFSQNNERSLKSHIQYFLDNKESPFYDEELMMAANEIYADLKSLSLDQKYSCWAPKLEGIYPGLILLGQTKQGIAKKVYVKRVDDHLNIHDLAVFNIAKNCKVRTPKVSLKLTQNACYLFSTAMDQQKVNKPDKIYSYKDIADYLIDSDYYLDPAQLTLSCHRQTDGNFAEVLPLHKSSMAKFFLTLLIFDLSDITSRNFGIVISHNNHNKKAKLALIDFLVETTAFDSSKLIEYKSLSIEEGGIPERSRNSH